jgi:xanthine dehydrogenase small subunit
VRNAGTVGGNIANGSPIGDMPPALIALSARIELRKGRQVRSMPVEEFYIEYGKQRREPGELITRIAIPHLKPGHVFRCYKVSKRFDQDISSVMGAFRFALNDEGIVMEAVCAYGGMAGIPKRADGAEAALLGQPLRDSKAWARAFAALRDDFKPLDDHRASARYRADTAHSLLGKALIEAAGTASRRIRVTGFREVETSAAG